MRVVIAPLLAALISAASPAPACQAPLPSGPPAPAPIVLQTSCGSFRLSTDGSVRRLPRGWLARQSGGSGRRYGSDLTLRRTRPGRFLLHRAGRLIWRSEQLYRNDGGNVAFGPNRFAFAAHRRGVFLTDLKGRERLVVRGQGLFPLAFTATGQLLVAGGRQLTLVSAAGRSLRRVSFRPKNGYGFDEETDTLYFVTPAGRLATMRGGRIRPGRSVAPIDGAMSFLRPGVLVFESARDLTVTRRDGSPLAHTRRSGDLTVSDSGVSVSSDGRSYAFRLSNARPGARRGAAALYVLHAGETAARAVYRHALGPVGCSVGASMRWHGGQLLYSSADGQLAVLDGGTGARLDLAALASALPRRQPQERPHADWASSYAR